MATLQNEWSKRLRSTPQPRSNGAVHCERFTADFTSVSGAVNDIVDMGELPAGAQIVDAYLASDVALAATTVDVGFMSGDFGDPSNARTSGLELFAGASLATTNATIVRAVKPDALFSAASNSGRSIGMKLLAAIAAGAGKKVHLVVFYRQ